jgi:hypothetical protein
MKKIESKFKTKTTNIFNIAKEKFTKSFDVGKIKSQELKDKIKLKIRKRAILATKARLIENHKTFDDYADDELEIIIADEEAKIMDDLKSKTLIATLAILGLDFLV